MKKIILLLLFTQLLQSAHSIPKATKTLISAVKVQSQIRKKNPIQTFSNNKNSTHTFSDNNDFVQFAQTFELPEHYKQLIEKYRSNPNNNAIFMQKINHWIPFNIQNIPGLYFKDERWERIINAKRLKKCIEKHNLYLITIPEKYIYLADNFWVVCAETVDENNSSFEITLEHVKQLLFLMSQTGFKDIRFKNIKCNKKNQIVLIDTENKSFNTSIAFTNIRVNNKTKAIMTRAAQKHLSLNTFHPPILSESKLSIYNDPTWNFNPENIKLLSKKNRIKKI